MRRIFAIVTSLLLVLSLVGPAGAFDGKISDVTILSAVVDRSGNVQIRGTLYCSQSMNVQIEWGQVEQVVGRTTTVRGGFGGWYESCTGTMPWESWARAESGKFAPGWATISLKFQGWSCDQNGCNPLNVWGDGQRYLKIVRAR
jgi:hypothetical protein